MRLHYWQMTLPIHVERIPTILGCPVVDSYFDEHLRQVIEVVGGRFIGNDYVYLVHLDQPLRRRVQHYLGSTNDLARRKKAHQRKYPSFSFANVCFHKLEQEFDRQLLEALAPLRGKTFKRYHTLVAALRTHLGDADATLHKFQIMSLTKQHNANGILMAANRCNIPWRIVRVFKANRKLEQAIKRQKHSFRHLCPVCQGVDVPF